MAKNLEKLKRRLDRLATAAEKSQHGVKSMTDSDLWKIVEPFLTDEERQALLGSPDKLLKFAEEEWFKSADDLLDSALERIAGVQNLHTDQ